MCLRLKNFQSCTDTWTCYLLKQRAAIVQKRHWVNHLLLQIITVCVKLEPKLISGLSHIRNCVKL